MRTGRKISGGRYHKQRKKKLFERIMQEKQVTIGDRKIKAVRVTGGKTKTFLLKANIANVIDSRSNKTKKAEILNVIETPQNKFLARQNRLIKGAIIETPLGKARITNRPTQEGQINALLLEEKVK